MTVINSDILLASSESPVQNPPDWPPSLRDGERMKDHHSGILAVSARIGIRLKRKATTQEFAYWIGTGIWMRRHARVSCP